MLSQAPAQSFEPRMVVKKPIAKKPVPRPTTVKATAPSATSATIPVSAASKTVASGKSTCTVTKIMPLGDSLTAFAESYRGPLFRLLKTAGYKVDFVGSLQWPPVGGGDADSEGHGGYTIGPDDRVDSDGKPGNIAQNIDGWLKQSKPDVVLVAIGTNDISGGSVVAAAAPAKLKSLVDRMHATYPVMTIVVGDVPPNIYNVKSPAETKSVNDLAKSLGEASATDNIFYGNTYATLTSLGFDPATGTSDGTHFTTAGGETYGKAWMPVVKAALDARRC